MRSRKWQPKYHEDPATISPPIYHRLQNIIPRLSSNLAIDATISAIRKRQIVHRLSLGTSSLCDSGCTRLFGFLTSLAGLRCRESLTELFLMQNKIGAQGLLAVATFLKGNMVLRELCLSGNPLTTDPHVIAEFTRAVNSSRLCVLQMHHSSFLGDSFAQVFLSQLSSPYLRELDLSATNMTQAIVPTLADYVRSSRCRLDRLQCNANNLTLTGTRKIISAIGENYSLRNVRLDLHIRDQTGAVSVEERLIEWQGCNRALSATLRRNSKLIDRVKGESLAMLRYSRALFLRSGTARGLSSPLRDGNSRSIDAPSLFFSLPAELQQQIISYLSPSLSHEQRMRIIYFASDTATLFSFIHPQSDGTYSWTHQLEARVTTAFGRRLPSSHGQPCDGTWRPPIWWECHCPSNFEMSCRCLRRWKKEMRDIWLTQVACNTCELVY